MEKKHTHSNKDFGNSVGNDAIFRKHLTGQGVRIGVALIGGAEVVDRADAEALERGEVVSRQIRELGRTEDQTRADAAASCGPTSEVPEVRDRSYLDLLPGMISGLAHMFHLPYLL